MAIICALALFTIFSSPDAKLRTIGLKTLRPDFHDTVVWCSLLLLEFCDDFLY